MQERPEPPVESPKGLRARAREFAQRSAEARAELNSLYRELSDLATRSIRRRRFGDGQNQ